MEFVIITLVIFLVETAFIYGTGESVYIKEKRFFWLFSIQAFVIFAFRDLLVLSDTLGYYYHFNEVKNTPLFDFDIYDRFGKGYLLYEKIIHNYISENFLVFNVLTTAITMIPVLKYFKNNSTCMWFTFLIFIASRLIFSEAIALRQGLALGVCMMGTSYLTNERKSLLKFIPFILLASTIHNSAIMYFIVFFIYFFNKGESKKTVFFLLVSFIFVFVAFESILGSYYSGSDGSTYLVSASETGYFNMVGVYSSLVAIAILLYVTYMRRLCMINTYDNLYVITIFFVLVSLLSIRLFVITRYLIYLYPFVIVHATQLYTAGRSSQVGSKVSRIFLLFMICSYLYIIYTRPEWVFFSDFKFWTNDISSYSIL